MIQIFNNTFSCFFLFFILSIFLTSCQHESTQPSNSVTSEANKSPTNCFEGIEENLPFDVAIKKLNERLKQFEQEQNNACYAEVLVGISGFYYYNEYLEEALATGLKSIDFIENHLDIYDEVYVTALHNQGIFNVETNNYKKALTYYKKALELENSPHTPTNDVSLANTHNAIGNVLKKMGDYENATFYLDNAILLLEKSKEGSSREMSPFLFDYAENIKLKNQPDSAIIVFKNCLFYIDDIQPDSIKNDKWHQQIVFNCYLGLAEMYLAKSAYEKADEYLQNALLIQNKFENISEDFYTYQLLGDKAFAQEDFKTALKRYQEAEKRLLKELQNHNKDPRVATLLAKQAKTASQLKNTEQSSLGLVQKALQSVCVTFKDDNFKSNPEISDIHNKYTAIEILYDKAKTIDESFKDNNKHALRAIHDCYDLINRLIPLVRSGFRAVKSKFLLSEKMSSIFENGIVNALNLYELEPKEKYLKDAYIFATANKSAALKESLQEKQATSARIIPESMVGQLEHLKSDLAFKENQLYQKLLNKKEKNDDQIAQLKIELYKAKESLDLKTKDLENDYPDYYNLRVKHEPTSVAAIQHHLSNEDLVLDYFVGQETIFLFSISKKEMDVFQIPITMELTQHVSRFNAQIRSEPTETDAKQYIKVAASIYNQLVKIGLQNHALTKHLIIIPDGFLHGIPFEALLIDEQEAQPDKRYAMNNLSYLFEKYECCYQYSTALMLHAIQKRSNKSKYGFVGICPLKELEYSSEEVHGIAKFVKNEKIFEHHKATKNNILNDIENAEIIHFATHATPNNQNPNLSAIALYNEEQLLSNKIEALKLNAKLVVLSACDTGLGKEIKGEGVMSLARSFQLAGSPATIASLWQVNDQATAQLMKFYYQHLQNAKSKSAALRQAKIDYLTHNKFSHEKSHPYFWSAFIQIGNVAPLN